MTDWHHFLQQQGGQLHSANGITSVESFGENSSQYPALLKQTLLFDLSHFTSLNFQGDGARNLLQGQTTCDFNALSDTLALLGAQCTPKGRMIATFFAIQNLGQVELLLPRVQADAVQQSLAKYAPFFRVTIEEKQACRLIGLTGPDSDAVCSDLLGAAPTEHLGIYQSSCGLALRLSKQRILLQIPAANAESDWASLSQQATPVGAALWALQEIRDGFGHVMPETREQLVPQMLNLQAIGGINFKKGCYTGQEVVARMHYLGNSKRHMYRLAITSAAGTDQLPTAGARCYLPDDEQVVGEVVNAAPADQTTIEVLAVFKESAVNAEQLQIGDLPASQVEWLSLPYSIS